VDSRITGILVAFYMTLETYFVTISTMRTSIVLSLCASVLMLCACDSASAVSSEDDAAKGWASTQTALAQGSSEVQTTRAAQTTVDIDASSDCQGGGTAHFKGSLETTVDVNDPLAGNSTNFDYTTTFAGCSTLGVTIDGTIDYQLMTTTSGEGAATVNYTYVGDLEWSGDVSGSCKIDMTASIETGTASVSATYSGTICGYDASATLNVSG